eukprot:TRINITY_DN1261_c0_g1_i2.p1 TRINITY_DN1261_c0_g1~~TRINITY_DN1261_c0_g1_i2.p1  ORF type:complete len:125 (-),score=18.40 TRINITY_DN1261_c0_g1_i2:95-469(-)
MCIRDRYQRRVRGDAGYVKCVLNVVVSSAQQTRAMDVAECFTGFNQLRSFKYKSGKGSNFKVNFAFVLYILLKCEDVKTLNPNATYSEVLDILYITWSQLSPKEREALLMCSVVHKSKQYKLVK